MASWTLRSVFRAGALAATSVVLGLAPLASTPTLAIGTQVQQTETPPDTPNTPNGKAPMPSPMLVPVTSPATSATRTDNCTPTTSLLRFDGGYEVSMCYVTPNGVAGQAKGGLYASAESGLLWFFSRDNAEVLVKVLNGCSINGHRWVFVAPVTTLEFDLRVTSPTGVRWSHGNTQGVTAATQSDVAAFACADEPDAAADLIVSGVSVNDATPVVSQNVEFRSTVLNVPNRGDGPASAASLRYHAPPDSTINTSDAFIANDTVAAPTRAAGPQTETTPDTPNDNAPVVVPAASPSPSTTPGCTPTTILLRFDGGYEVSMCYRTPGGVVGQAKAGLYASAESGLLWFFSRDNAEVLVKVLNGCAINGYRWVFVAPVTTLEFDLQVTSPTGVRWSHGNTQGETAATKSDVAAFACADEPETAPDLIVSGVTVSDAAPVAGETITLRATVRNRGDGPATPTTLRYYRSDDSTISASDNSDDLLASDAVAALAASASESRTLDFTVPSTPGTFYLGACVDSVPAESRTGNNCSNGVRVVVEDDPEEPETAPDLTVSQVTVSDADPVAGQTVTLRATVRNRGDGTATPTTLRFHRSNDSTISASDLQLGADAVAALAASATESRTFDLAVPSTAGTFYLGACIDAVVDESDTGNNCSAGVRVVVEDDPEEPETAPDLTVSRVTVSDPNPAVEDVFEFRVTVLNRGNGPASATTIGRYKSDDSTISTSDLWLESEALPALVPSATESRTFSAQSGNPGPYYLGACIEPVAGESDTGNNCSDGVLVTVEQPPAPDLTVPDFSVSDENPVTNAVVELQATVQNQGDGPAPPTTLHFYRSGDSTIGRRDTELGSGAVAELAASATASLTFDFTVPSTPGTFYVGACIDDSVSAESDTGNNCSDGVQVVVREPAPDLVVSNAVSPNPIFTDERIEFTATVRNQGNAPSPRQGVTLSAYLSDDSTINASDEFWASTSVPALAVSATWSWSLSHSHSVPVTYYMGACVSGVFGESDTDNNCSDGVLVNVEERPPAPDLIVFDFSVDDENPYTGDEITMDAEVRNQGDAPASSSRLGYYWSNNSTIDTSDNRIHQRTVPALSPSDRRILGRVWDVSLSAGTYYFGACVASVAGESDMDNNCSDGVQVVVDGPAPDLIVFDFSVDDRYPDTGDEITMDAEVRNQGDAPASSSRLGYYWSNNSTIDTSDNRIHQTTVPALSPSDRRILGRVWDVSLSAGTYYFGACVTSVAGELDTSNNCSDGVRVVVD